MDDPRCAIEHTKYAGIGATVLSTAVLASLSGSYAIYTTFRSVPISVCLGIVWGLIIFNLDRYIVSSIRRQRINPTLSRKERAVVRAREISRALPRLLLAVFISVVITRPIELKLFEPEIKADLESKKSQMLADIERQKRLEFPRIDELVAENAKLRQLILVKEKERNDAHELAMSEALGKPGARTTGVFGKGIVYEQRWQAYLRAEAELAALRNTNDAKSAANEQTIASLTAEREASIRSARAEIEGMEGLLARLQALSSLADKNFSILVASLFIIGLFMLLETAPIIVKLLSERGPYEDIYEAKEHEVYVSERRRISNINDDANTRVSLKHRRNAAILDAESRLRKSLIASMETLAAEELRRARKEVAATLVEHWKTAELKNLEARFGAAHHPKNGNKNAPIFVMGDQKAEAAEPAEAVHVEAPDAFAETPP